jgi:diguanylate cyclase (GGDEF)-like protein
MALSRPAAWILLAFAAGAAASAPPDYALRMYTGPSVPAAADLVTAGTLDQRFQPYQYRAARRSGEAFWLRLTPAGPRAGAGVPVLIVHKGRHLQVDVYAAGAGPSLPLVTAMSYAGFRGAEELVLLLPQAKPADTPLYAHIRAVGRGAEELDFMRFTLDQALARGDRHARMIALSFGALVAMALAGLLIWFVLADVLFILYAALFCLQALYIAYLSGQGFEWPVLRFALPLTSLSWNVPAALSGAVGCLFAREIADLRRFSPRIHRLYGILAMAFLALAAANLAKLIGFGPLVAAVGNLLFLAVAVLTLVVSFLAWRRGSRPAGWFLIAWALMEMFTIATTLSWLLSDSSAGEAIWYLGLPLSMVLAALLVALGVADRLREQRAALSDAERRAQTDPLTGVLNRRSLLERLEAACHRAQARGLPIAVLFIDLDHFKRINDSHGHAAGDACLAAIIAPIQSELRQSDVVGRYGGEEFVILLSSADLSAALPVAERIVARVAALRVEGFGPPIALTCSIGVATSDALGVWGPPLIARADAAVYEAKRAGRNQVQVAVPVAAEALQA